MSRKEATSQPEVYDSVLIVGPDISSDQIADIEAEAKKSGRKLCIIGDGETYITEEQVTKALLGKVDGRTQFFLYGHGHVVGEKHNMRLVEDTPTTLDVIKKLNTLLNPDQSFKDPFPSEVHVFSCDAGQSADDYEYLSDEERPTSRIVLYGPTRATVQPMNRDLIIRELKGPRLLNSKGTFNTKALHTIPDTVHILSKGEITSYNPVMSMKHAALTAGIASGGDPTLAVPQVLEQTLAIALWRIHFYKGDDKSSLKQVYSLLQSGVSTDVSLPKGATYNATYNAIDTLVRYPEGQDVLLELLQDEKFKARDDIQDIHQRILDQSGTLVRHPEGQKLLLELLQDEQFKARDDIQDIHQRILDQSGTLVRHPEGQKLLLELLQDEQFKARDDIQDIHQRILDQSVVHGQWEFIATLLDKKIIDPNAQITNSLSGEKDGTLLHWAAKSDRVDVVQKVLESKDLTSHQTMDADGTSPLHWAQSSEMLDLFLSDPRFTSHLDYQSSMGQTPLYFAALCNRTEVVEALLKEGADPTIPSKESLLPLHAAAMKNSRTGVLKVLLEDAQAKGPLDQAVLDEALALACSSKLEPQGAPTNVDLLLHAGADPTSVEIKYIDNSAIIRRITEAKESWKPRADSSPSKILYDSSATCADLNIKGLQK